jgi:hypothetical protein
MREASAAAVLAWQHGTDRKPDPRAAVVVVRSSTTRMDDDQPCIEILPTSVRICTDSQTPRTLLEGASFQESRTAGRHDRVSLMCRWPWSASNCQRRSVDSSIGLMRRRRGLALAPLFGYFRVAVIHESSKTEIFMSVDRSKHIFITQRMFHQVGVPWTVQLCLVRHFDSARDSLLFMPKCLPASCWEMLAPRPFHQQTLRPCEKGNRGQVACDLRSDKSSTRGGSKRSSPN